MPSKPGVKAGRAETAKQPVVTPLRDEHRRVTRDRLVSAAEALFTNEGFRATTVDQIAKAAGTTVTTFYRYFETKSELFHLLQQQLSVEIDGILQKLADATPLSRDGLRAWMGDYYRMWRRVHRLCDAYWEAVGTDDVLAAGSIPETLRLSERLRELMRPSAPSGSPFHVQLAIVILTMDRVALLVQCEKESAEQSAILDAWVDVVWALLKNPDKTVTKGRRR